MTRLRSRLPVAVLVAMLAVAGCDQAPPPDPLPRLDPPPAEAGGVLPTADPAGGDAVSLPTTELLRLLESGSLGADPGAVVLDARTGDVLLDRRGGDPRTPASVLKLATAAAALRAMDPEVRLRTRVVSGGTPGEVVLVGAGDTTLTAHADRSTEPRRADLQRLAVDTALALRSRGVDEVTVRVDDSLFTGVAVSPDWPGTYVSSGVVSPVSALSADGGRLRPGEDARAADPAVHTGGVFAEMLRAAGLSVGDGVTRAATPPGAEEIAAVESPTVAQLVELMLASSDNDLAESLLRLVAHERGRPASFADGVSAVAETLAGLGIAVEGMRLLDGSGLARGSLIAPATLAQLLVQVAHEDTDPALDHLLTGLPVAGFSGTLSTRFDRESSSAAGVVRAKTGTLTGVSTLAGVADVGGRPVVFVVMADQVRDTLAARAVLDRFAAALVSSR